ncbi:uncharacterized protein NEMAJ01_2110 [Nematocida major]|uniref:uncharacterized protein n=1 Tax=Nematocida major TaxID=1912982 RepID=UPI0020079F34|nr:uncharacterized protein NEMAJ01_2110 [Nematocida major]KAH9387214.1 hypothetical protein NEMAJ01_2110 [Nematocida major]
MGGKWVQLDFKRTKSSDIQPGEDFAHTDVAKKLSSVYKEFVTCGIDSDILATPLTIRPGLTIEERQKNWAFTNFFKTKETIPINIQACKKSLERPASTITINRSAEKGSPYIMYSVDGHKYYIHKDRTTDRQDSTVFLTRQEAPQKIGLHKSTVHFLGRDSLDVVAAETRAKYRLSVPNAIDMAIPEKRGSTIPVLRDRGLGKPAESMLFDRVDMATGKIEGYRIACSGQGKFRKVGNTWHPKQYVCLSADAASVVDVREKASRSFWRLKTMGKGNVGAADVPSNYKVEKGRGSTMHIFTGYTLGAFDMRNLSAETGLSYTNITNGTMSVGKHIAVYNKYGHFYFQNAQDSSDSIVKIYKFNTDKFLLGFEWAGKSEEHMYSTAAFLFSSKVCIYTGDGNMQEHPIDEYRVPNAPEHRLATTLRLTGSFVPLLFNKNRPLVPEEEHDSRKLTLLERSLQDGFRDPLVPASMEGIAQEPNESVKKVIPYTNMMNFLTVGEKASLLKPKKDRKEHPQ